MKHQEQADTILQILLDTSALELSAVDISIQIHLGAEETKQLLRDIEVVTKGWILTNEVHEDKGMVAWINTPFREKIEKFLSEGGFTKNASRS